VNDERLLDDIVALLEAEGLTELPENSANPNLSKRYRPLLRNKFRRAIREGRVATWYEGSHLVALAHWTAPDRSGTAELVGIITRSTYRGRGYATLLMHEVHRRCRAQDVAKLVSYTSAGDEVAASMHEFFGFEAAGTIETPDGLLLKWTRDMIVPFSKGPQDCTYTREEQGK